MLLRLGLDMPFCDGRQDIELATIESAVQISFTFVPITQTSLTSMLAGAPAQ